MIDIADILVGVDSGRLSVEICDGYVILTDHRAEYSVKLKASKPKRSSWMPFAGEEKK